MTNKLALPRQSTTTLILKVRYILYNKLHLVHGHNKYCKEKATSIIFHPKL